MKIELGDLQRYIQRGPALVVGPGMSTSSSRDVELLNRLRAKYAKFDGSDAIHNPMDYADALVANAIATEVEVRTFIETFYQDLNARNPAISVMIKVNWTAVISLCADDHIRTELGEFIYKKPTKWTVSTVAAATDALSQTTVPYYALLGDLPGVPMAACRAAFNWVCLA